jgi:hypothetical protein
VHGFRPAGEHPDLFKDRAHHFRITCRGLQYLPQTAVKAQVGLAAKLNQSLAGDVIATERDLVAGACIPIDAIQLQPTFTQSFIEHGGAREGSFKIEVRAYERQLASDLDCFPDLLSRLIQEADHEVTRDFDFGTAFDHRRLLADLFYGDLLLNQLLNAFAADSMPTARPGFSAPYPDTR